MLGAVCHVDLIVAGQLADLEWLLEVMKKRFVLSESGILPQAGQTLFREGRIGDHAT